MGASTATDQQVGAAVPQNVIKAFESMAELTSLPEVTSKIVEIVEDPRASARDMHDIVRTDPPLAAKILKVVNSAFYGLPAQVASLDRAILMLGLSAVKNITLAASLSRMFKADAVSDQFSARDIWRHSVGVGVCAREVARLGGAQNSEEFFVSGLVHDVGLIVSHQLFPDESREIIERCYSETQDFLAIERELIGADHQQLGGLLAAKWKFPASLRLAMTHHHKAVSVAPEHQQGVATIGVADTLCALHQEGFWLTGASQQMSDSLLSFAGVTAEQVEELGETLRERIDEAERIFAE